MYSCKECNFTTTSYYGLKTHRLLQHLPKFQVSPQEYLVKIASSEDISHLTVKSAEDWDELMSILHPGWVVFNPSTETIVPYEEWRSSYQKQILSMQEQLKNAKAFVRGE